MRLPRSLWRPAWRLKSNVTIAPSTTWLETQNCDSALRRPPNNCNPCSPGWPTRSCRKTSCKRLRAEFERDPVRQKLQQKVTSLMDDPPEVASWFVCDERGTHLAGEFKPVTTSTIGVNFANRTYCYGGLRDIEDPKARPMPAQHVQHTNLSAPFFSRATKRWKIAVSTPLYRSDDPTQLLAVLVLTRDVGDFMTFKPKDKQFAVLVDGRDNGYQGMLLDHPWLTKSYSERAGLSDVDKYRISLESLTQETCEYEDPLDKINGQASGRKWIAAVSPVSIRQGEGKGDDATVDTGLVVLVQEDKASATEPVRDLGRQLAAKGVQAIAGFFLVVGLLWYFVFRVQGGRRWWRRPPFAPGSSIATPTPAHTRSTAAERGADDRKS